ncbi:SDR family NAD(P)-dependent oxidoreductase [Nocardioides humi]|nr:SDR family oxidoreductase [Nocardioides humi]
MVTGATRGLGRHMVEAFAARGAEVIVVSRKQEACEQVARELQETHGGIAHAHSCHMGSWEAVTDLATDVHSSLGPLDVLVNNAGISPTYDSLTSISEELWDKTLDVNLKGPFRLSALVGAEMVSARGGTIINISSVASIRPAADWLPYSTAKAGLNAMTEGLARGLGPTVRVNGVICGAFLTDIAQGWDESGTQARMKATTALERAADPSEIVGTVLYLSSDLSSYTTGAMIRVDGGRI